MRLFCLLDYYTSLHVMFRLHSERGSIVLHRYPNSRVSITESYM